VYVGIDLAAAGEPFKAKDSQRLVVNDVEITTLPGFLDTVLLRIGSTEQFTAVMMPKDEFVRRILLQPENPHGIPIDTDHNA
jgi:hypothetical protein